MWMQSSIHLARPVFALCVAFSLLLPCVAQAQDPTREVLPEQKQARAFVSPTGLARLGSRMLFTAFHVDTGQELWSTDGTTAQVQFGNQCRRRADDQTITVKMICATWARFWGAAPVP